MEYIFVVVIEEVINYFFSNSKFFLGYILIQKKYKSYTSFKRKYIIYLHGLLSSPTLFFYILILHHHKYIRFNRQ